MKAKFEDGKVCIITREWSNFYAKTIDVETIISIDDAVKLRAELDEAICASQPVIEADAKKYGKCPHCGEYVPIAHFDTCAERTA